MKPFKSQKSLKLKKIIAGIILIPVVLFILLMIMVDDDTAPSQESIKTETNINSVALTTATQDITKAVTDTPITLPTPVYNHYILTANTVQDTKSGLIWRYCPVGRFGSTGECMGETSLLTYPEMVSEIDNLNTQNKSLGIQGAWRLPTLKEIETIKLCDKSITALTIDNKPVDASYACKALANAKSSDFFDNIAFPYLANTGIWSSDKVSQTDMALFDNQEEGYWTVNLSNGSIAKTTPKEKKELLY